MIDKSRFTAHSHARNSATGGCHFEDLVNAPHWVRRQAEDRSPGPSATMVDISKQGLRRVRTGLASERVADAELVEIGVVVIQLGRWNDVEAGVEAEVVDHLRL